VLDAKGDIGDCQREDQRRNQHNWEIEIRAPFKKTKTDSTPEFAEHAEQGQADYDSKHFLGVLCSPAVKLLTWT
jgi:hypothetical protein